MAGNIDVLSARLEVKDSFSSQLDKFSNKINNAENTFNKFISSIDKSSLKIETSLDRINRKIDQTVNKITSQTNNITSVIERSSTKIEQSQTKAINNLTSKYQNMGKDVGDIFKVINKDAETLAKSGIKLNLGGSKSKVNSNENDNKGIIGGTFAGQKTENFLGGILSGNFTKILGSMSLIGAGITGVVKTLDTIDNWMQQSYNVLNTLSTGLLSPSGIYEGAKEAGKFEQNRVAMDVLYGGNEELGQKYYKMGVQSAKATTYGEQDTGELQQKLAGAHISYNQDQLNLLADIATLKPNVPLEHVGFSIVDAMYGRTTSLKSMYMLDNKEVQKYLKDTLAGKIIDKETGQKINGKQWKDAFNSKGAVKNKQEYFDLLMSFVENETYYKGLNHKRMQTTLGKLDRLQGNWETLKAEVLGIDANNTGKVKSGSAIDALGKSLDNLSNWLEQSNTKYMLDSLGKSLGTTVSSIADTFEKFLQKVKWDKVGDTFEKIGKTVESLIEKLNKDGTLDKLLEALPTLVDVTLKDKVIEAKTKVSVGSNLASGNYFDAFKAWGHGFDDKIANYLGFSDTMDKVHNAQDYISSGSWLTPRTNPETNTYLTNVNADAYLAQNLNLTESDKKRVKDAINEESGKGHNVYHITVGEVKTDGDPLDLINKITNLQSNSK